MARCDAPGVAGDDEAEVIRAAFEAAGATWSERSTDQEEADALFAARRLVYPALARLGAVLTEDICVPRTAVTDVLTRIEQIAGEHDVRIACLAHAGDGNLHPMVVVPPGDEKARTRGRAAFERVVDLAVDAGGTVTGEHGVGLLKMRGLARELSPAVMAMHRAIKNALDPAGILNPGKVFPADG